MVTLTILACYVAAHSCISMPSSLPSMAECEAAIDAYEAAVIVESRPGLAPVAYRCSEDE